MKLNMILINVRDSNFIDSNKGIDLLSPTYALDYYFLLLLTMLIASWLILIGNIYL